MAYYIDLFSPETYNAFSNSDRTVSGFSERQKGVVSEIQIGDKLICYVTRVSRWVGILEVTSKYFIDRTPLFTPADDPFVLRFKVKTLMWFALENSLPVWNDIVWKKLSFTKKLPPNSLAWTGMVRASPRKLSDSDGQILSQLLSAQNQKQVHYPFSEFEQKKLKATIVKTQDSKQVAVSIPENEDVNQVKLKPESRDSIKIQALLAEIGEKMNFKIWLPKPDRQRIANLWTASTGTLLEILPLNYDDATLNTIENIDVLWIKGRSIVRAFEVEHTTSIYSGILRMADLMALQPNLNIQAHIVAPIDRKEKVLKEISRPVFAFLEKRPLSESCSFLSYDTIQELSKEKRLSYMRDEVLEEYAEYAGESDF